MSAWPDPSALFEELADDNLVKRKAKEGDMEAQWSMGYWLLSEDGVEGMPLGATGRSRKADVGLALCTAQFHQFPH